ncbi:PrgI family protein [Candidatus Woesearchaeota archaeon]|nr:PrgI family protein [Candidatus Woesearchaeota archaeon]
MAYKIPKNLTKYSELFLWGLSFKQFGYLTATALAMLFVFMKLNVALWVKIMLAVPIFMIGLLFVYGKVDEKWASDHNLKKSLRNTGYYDPKIDSFIAIKEINDNTVFLKTGKMLAILKAQPINFSILSREQQDYVLNTYRNWLRSLDYEVQVTCRSVDLDMDGWLDSLSKREQIKKDKERFTAFRQWITTFIEEKKVRNRVFYITVPLVAVIKKEKSFWNSLKSILLGSDTSSIDRNHPSYKKALRELDDRVKNCIEALAPASVKVERLENNELLGLYSSYFTNMPGGGKSYLTPVMWPSKGQEAKLN